MNQVILIGNLANNPEVRKTPNGVSTCMFRLAVQRRYKNPQTGKADGRAPAGRYSVLAEPLTAPAGTETAHLQAS